MKRKGIITKLGENMQDLLQMFQGNEAFLAYENGSSDLGNLSLIEEALMIAFSFQRERKARIVVKHNLYTAQKL